jgi:hypothetical protein
MKEIHYLDLTSEDLVEELASKHSHFRMKPILLKRGTRQEIVEMLCRSSEEGGLLCFYGCVPFYSEDGKTVLLHQKDMDPGCTSKSWKLTKDFTGYWILKGC